MHSIKFHSKMICVVFCVWSQLSPLHYVIKLRFLYLINVNNDVSALELTLQNNWNLFHQWLSETIRMHRIGFTPGIHPIPRWGSSRCSSNGGEGYPIYTPAHRRLRHLDLLTLNLVFVPACLRE